MPERTVDRVIRKVILNRSDDEALKAHCARRGVTVERLVEQILADAAAAARKAVIEGRLEAGRRNAAPADLVVPEAEQRARQRQEAKDMRLLELQARHGAAFMTPAGIPATPVPDRSVAFTVPPAQVAPPAPVPVQPDPPAPAPVKPAPQPKPSPPADIVAFVNAPVGLPLRLPPLSEAVLEPTGKRSYVRLRPLIDEIRAYLEVGYSDREIARHYGASSAGVADIRRELGMAPNPLLSRSPLPPVD